MTTPGVIVSGSTEIPVRNLWLLMLYASTLFQRDERLRTGSIEDNPDELFDLVSEILVTATERRLQRSLGRQYRSRSDTLTRVRGQIDVLATESRMLLAQGRVACRFDELSVDNLRNRVLRTALVLAARHVGDLTLERRARSLAEILTQYGVSSQLVTQREAAQLALGRNEQDDVEAIDAARLLLQMTIPAESVGKHSTRDPEREAQAIRRLYEAAVRGFYRAVLPSEWKVAVGEVHHHWPVIGASSGLMAVLPIMKTDTLLESASRRIIVETKFADALKPNQYGAIKLSRDHVFQLYAYVQSQHGKDELSTTAEGVLLYPVVGQHLDETATIQGHRYRFMTVDLGASASSIRDTLLSVPRNAGAVR
ncbi:5-methylcytosine-specific restriction endonuclease system specificity protein McrC [Gordonia sp. HNM0687]|uniref:5-methylcytosine-specific restriction endonuclease system specificity protein McrC n=1 Tax=Gordonia mangrovi TaxID=2665643 RepID=A0A6L7GQN3_9ACTN|nr:5-methylcytosine-specific restriction endonuclease system specificity protein McrC [Gordonia mangrovi]MXP21952.1 5-methylcytosine-specific restriction endonuclease system specificity protein McrC [Gordonia mangrovi]UVF76313.1 5-methylcytosine-specific restriction endonuclease system specificity protein McrC [Gordonia mangrovi]